MVIQDHKNSFIVSSYSLIFSELLISLNFLLNVWLQFKNDSLDEFSVIILYEFFAKGHKFLWKLLASKFRNLQF